MDKSKIEHLNKQEYTHLPHAEQEFENHEQTDVAIRPLVVTLLVLAAVVAVSYVGMVGVFTLFDNMEKGSSSNPKLTNVEGGIRRVPEGFPALQGVQAKEANPNTPAQDMDQLRARNDAVLGGRVAMRDGIARGMPIDRAMDEAMSRKIFKTAGAEGNDGGNAPMTPPASGGGQSR
jgi:C4-type Zn-finger protein